MENSGNNLNGQHLNSPNNPNAPNNNRLYLNFANDRFAPNDRAYPTTPSTFPQPVFPPGQSQQQAPTQNAQQPYGAGYAQQPGYFMNNPYPPQYAQQQPAAAQYQSNQQIPQPSYQPRSNNANVDPTNGLAHQFSHQNLGGAPRSPYGSRQPSPSQRPRTAGNGQQQAYNNYLSAPAPNQPTQQYVPEFQVAPERNPDKYGPITQNNQKKCAQLAADFFKDSVKRARDRNVR
jgi:protein-serine/threonine kinase